MFDAWIEVYLDIYNYVHYMNIMHVSIQMCISHAVV